MNASRLNRFHVNAERPGGNRGAVALSTGLEPMRKQELTPCSSQNAPGASTGALSMAHHYALPAELARPVADGTLSRTDALSGMLAGTLAADRRKQLEGYDPFEVFKLQRHLFFQHLRQLEIAHAIAEQQEWLRRRRHG